MEFVSMTLTDCRALASPLSVNGACSENTLPFGWLALPANHCESCDVTGTEI